MEIKIKRKEATISSDTIEIPAQGSANIPVVLENDSSYSNYIKEVHCGYYLNGVYCKVILPIENEKYLIPLEAFKFSGPLYLAVALVNVKEIIKTNQINFEVRAAPNGKVILPTENEWHILVKNYMDSLFENDYGDRFDEIGTNLEELAAEVQTQQEKITSQQTQIDNAIGNMGDYEIVQEDPVQIRFKKGDGTFGETVDLGDGLASKAMVNAGYYTYKDISYGGSASNNGIDVAEIDGAYSQVTTNGFQLFDASKLPTKSQGGATVTSNGDGSFTISGSGNLTESYNNGYSYSHEETLKLLKVGGIKLDTGNITYPFLEWQLRYNGKAITLNNFRNEISTNTITQEMLDASDCFVRILFFGEKDSAIQAGTIKPMLYQDGDGIFEPYTGGIASPNPEYPQEPKFVGDIGQNLFDASKLPTKSQGGATATNNGDGSFTISGSGNLTSEFSQLYRYTHEETLKMLKVGKIILNQNGDNTTPYAIVRLIKTGNTSIWFQLTKNTQSANITQEMLQDNDCALIILLYGSSGSTIETGTIKPMLYQDGDGQYRPYSENPKYYLDFVTSGKNLFDFNYLKNNYAIRGTKTYTDNSITLTSTGDDCYDNSFSSNTNFRIPVLPNKQYTLMLRKTNNVAGVMYIFPYTKNNVMHKQTISTNISYTGNIAYTFTTPQDCYYVSFRVGINLSGNTCTFSDFMVLYGTHTWDDVTEFIPFQGFETTTVELNQPLRELPNGVKDTIENEVVTRRVGEITFNGSETWLKNAGNTNNWLYHIAITHVNAKGLCDSLPHNEIDVINSDGSGINRVGFNFTQYEKVMYLNVGYYMEQAGLTNTVDNLKTWLQSNPITVWYELATPTTEQITLPTLPSWYSYTDAWVGTELQPSFVEWHIKIAGVNQNDLTVIKEDISQLQTETTQLNDDVTKLMGAFTSVTDLTKQLFLLMHRVGDIIFSTSDENPSTIYGGTWVAWGKGQVPVGVDTSDSDFNTVEKTGGSKECELRALIGAVGGNVNTIGYDSEPVVSGYGSYDMVLDASAGAKPQGASNTTRVVKSDGKSPTTVQPYITCYMWKRVS